MEIKINIEKKHLYYLTSLICLLLIGLVMAITPSPWSPGMIYHEPLYTDTITSKNPDGAVTVEDDLEVTGDTIISGSLDINMETKQINLGLGVGSDEYDIGCSNGFKAISCGILKSTSAVEEDAIGCHIDHDHDYNGCIFWKDVDTNPDTATGYCYCINWK